MRIDLEKCTGCMKCIPFCGVEAILKEGKKCVIDEERCNECDVCLKSDICPVDAFEEVSLEWPRILRHSFSSVHAKFKDIGVNGRGTAEMKTNDVTGRYRLGEVGFTIDVGRPGVGTTFEDVEKIAMEVAKVGVQFEPLNPTTKLMVETKTGKFRDDIKKERVLSCILEFKIDEDKLLSVISILKEVAKKVNTVFSVGCISRCNPDGSIPVKALLEELRVNYRPNGKVNIGLGHPLAD